MTYCRRLIREREAIKLDPRLGDNKNPRNWDNPFWAAITIKSKEDPESLFEFCMAYLTSAVKRNDDIKKRFSSFSLLCTGRGWITLKANFFLAPFFYNSPSWGNFLHFQLFPFTPVILNFLLFPVLTGGQKVTFSNKNIQFRKLL